MLLAGELMAKALFLRGFYMANDLKYDAAGRVQGAPKGGDWTLAGMNVLKVERHSPTEIEIDGLRAVIRYNTELHEFQRHPLNDEKMRLVVETGQDEGNAHALEAALGAIFSVGIDPALQRSMPDYWRHYFDPSLAWPQDQLSGQTIYALYGQADQAKEVTPPVVQHRTDAKFTSFAERDKVQGPLQLRMVVDAEGVPQRITVSRPLGYGLDAAAVEAMTKWRFSPGTRQGAPVATGVVVEQDFTIVARPR
jgi:TonB family protein